MRCDFKAGDFTNALAEKYDLRADENGTLHITNKPMNPPGNPTEIETKLAELEAEVIAINESIKNQDHVIWLAKVEKSKQKAILNATHAAIDAITKPKES